MRSALLLAAVVLALAAAGAGAQTLQITKTVGPITIGGYEVRQDTLLDVPTPGVDGYITDMRVNVVDKQGRPLPIRRITLHHVVFLNAGNATFPRHDQTCGQFTMWDSKSTLPAIAERFYAAGEERQQLQLPNGYGYPIRKDDHWIVTYMLMNHRQLPDGAYIQYRMTVQTGVALHAVTPYWLDVRNCLIDPMYTVPGGGRKGATQTTSSTFTMPVAGRLIAGGGHMHGGAKQITLTEPSCGNRRLATFTPTWGLPGNPFYHVRPVLHEPGPINVTRFETPTGIPLAKGDTVRINATYDDTLPHMRVMGIAIVFVAPDPAVTQACGALPGDVTYSQRPPGRTVSPRFVVPLTGIDPDTGKAITIDAPPGHRVEVRSGSTIEISNYSFAVSNVGVRRGARLSWKFDDTGNPHNVTVADGPTGFASKSYDSGERYTQRFTKPGVYRIFCALHPVAMTETIVVK